MASAIIHMAVANEINKTIKRDNNKLLIGSIAPDIAKLVGENKIKSHFLDIEDTDIPNIDKFLIKYQKKLDDDFVMGYYIHLYTDYLWFKYFMSEVDFDKMFKNLKGEYIPCTKESFKRFVYDDYTNLNVDVIDMYNLDLSPFYEELPKIKYIIKEIPMDNIKLIINKTGQIIINSKTKKSVVFDLSNVISFINSSVPIILSEIEKLRK